MTSRPPNETLDRLIQQSGELYSLPAVAIELLRLTEQPDVDARQLKECIENDPALTTRLLRVVNSSLFGLSREVSDLNQALALLGIKPLKLLVLGFSLPEGLFQSIERDLLARYWQYSLTKAVAARELCAVLGHAAGDEAFLAGLLEDLGMLALIQRVGQPYVRFIEHAWGDGGDLCHLERLALGFDHVQLSVALLERWGMPPSLLGAMRGYTADGGSLRSSEGLLRRVVELADLVAQIVVDGQTERWPELVDAAQRLGLAAADVTQLIDSLEEKVRDLAEVLRVDLPEGQSYRDVMAEAHRRLAEEAVSAAVELAAAGRAASPAADAASRDLLDAVTRLVDSPSGGDPAAARDQATAAATAEQNAAVAMAAAPDETAFVASTQSASLAVTFPALVARIRELVAACRNERCGLSLLLVELDRYEDVVFRLGPQRAERVRQLVGKLCETVDHERVTCVEAGEARFAVLLPDCERDQAVRLGRDLLRQVATLLSGGDRAQPAVALSIGAATVAMPPKNFPAEDLLEAAARCLYGAQTSGGNTVKSIEIY